MPSKMAQQSENTHCKTNNSAFLNGVLNEFIGRADATAPILWTPDVKSRLTGKALMLGKAEGRRRGRQRMGGLDGITDSVDLGVNKL